MHTIMNVLLGLFMALADSVPGVSGGTIAFIMGYYDEFINSLYNIVKGNGEQKKKAVSFLIKLILGWIVGFILMVLLLGIIFDSHIYEFCSLFIGLSLASIPLVIKQEWKTIRGRYTHIIFTICGILLVSGITFLRSNGEYAKIDVTSLNLFIVVYVIIAAAIAMSAMVMPGLSGSSLLLIMGLYMPIMGAARGLIKGDFRNVAVLILYLLGVVIGVVVSIRFIKTFLEKRRSQLIHFIIGLIIGSVYSIFMGPETLEVPRDSMSLSTFNFLFFCVGCMIIYGLEYMKRLNK